MRALIEAIKKEKPDYWRTVGGHALGFKGKPGDGEQIAGRPLGLGAKNSKKK
jgi:hypothetical protein